MSKELYIDSRDGNVQIALLENKVLVELHKEKQSNSFRVGDIYVGKVKKLIPGLNAAFVDIGCEKDAFLHYQDLGSRFTTFHAYTKQCLQGNVKSPSLSDVKIIDEINKHGEIKDVLSAGDLILTQISKEAISTKGPRLSGEISLVGRFCIMLPFSEDVMVSQKIKSKAERNRLRDIMLKIKPPHMGIIIRTVAKDQNLETLHADMRLLLSKWNDIVSGMRGNRFPKLVASELDKTSVVLRDMLNDTFDAIYVHKNYFNEVKNYIQHNANNQIDLLKLYKKEAPMFEYYGIARQIKSSFGRSVSLKGGVYLIIEHTEALHVIDVNSGHRVSTDKTQEDNALDVNISAAKEIARQLRLRDMGGIIIVDFIDMRRAANRKALYKCMLDEMSKDKARHTILPVNKFGLIQITRQRVRPEINIEIRETCPSCSGTGKVRPPVLIVDEIENNLQILVQKNNERYLEIQVHPFLYAYLTRHLFCLRLKWMIKYRCKIKLTAVESFQLLEYRFFSNHIGEINFNETQEEFHE